MIITIKINLSSVFGLSILNLRSIPAGHSGYLVSVNYLYRLERDIYYMDLKVKKQTRSGLNTEFVNTDTGRRVTLEHAIRQIEKGNPNYSGYQSIQMKSGTVHDLNAEVDDITVNNTMQEWLSFDQPVEVIRGTKAIWFSFINPSDSGRLSIETLDEIEFSLSISDKETCDSIANPHIRLKKSNNELY